MDKRDVARLLLFAATMDYRVNNQVETVEAWALVLDGDMEQWWAAEYARSHYANSTDALVAATMNAAWRKHRAATRAAFVKDDPMHCGRSSCRCTHSECDHGWIPGAVPAVKCPTCSPQQLAASAGHRAIM